MNKPKVSIIVPIYNVENYLPCCVNSLLNQTLKDIEIILVDDESPDHCSAICDEYAKQDHRVKVIHKKNEGVSNARNSGLEIATGEYIAFVDSDDYVELNTYQKLYTLMTDTKADVVYFDYQRFDNLGNTWTELNNRKEKEKRYQTENNIRRFMLDMIANTPSEKYYQDIMVSVWRALYHSNIIKMHEIKFKERGLFVEDLQFNLDFLLHSTSVITISDVFYYWRTYTSSYTNTVKLDYFEKNYFYYQYLLEMLRKNNFGIEGYLRATRFFIGISNGNMRHNINSSLTKKEKIQWLKKVVNHPIWRKIASSYPYKKLPWRQSLQFYLLQKGFFHLLYYILVIKKTISKNY